MGRGTSGNSFSNARRSRAFADADAAPTRRPPLVVVVDATDAISLSARTENESGDDESPSRGVGVGAPSEDAARERERIRARAVDKVRRLDVDDGVNGVARGRDARGAAMATEFDDVGVRRRWTARARVASASSVGDGAGTMSVSTSSPSTSAVRARGCIARRGRRRVDGALAGAVVGRRPIRARATREDDDDGDGDGNGPAQRTDAVVASSPSSAGDDDGDAVKTVVIASGSDASTATGAAGDDEGHHRHQSRLAEDDDASRERDEEDEEDGEHHEIVEYEEYEEEVDYELHDYVADAKTALARLRPDFTWDACERDVAAATREKRVEFLSVNASRTSAASVSVDAHSAVGLVLAIGSLWSARAIRMELEKRDASATSARATREMSEEERAREAQLREERRLREEEAERERRKRRDEEEAAEREREEERARLQAEADARAAAEEEKRREEMRAELRRRNAEEKARLEARLKREAEEKAAKVAAERAERERERLEREKKEAEEEARRQVECDARGETQMTVSADTSVVMKRDHESAPVEVTVTARLSISEGATETATFRDADEARVAALPMCSAVARRAVTAYGSDARLADMIGNGPLSKLPGIDDLEFEHWTRVMQARMDGELRTAIIRCGASLEVKLRESKRGGSETSKGTIRFQRRCLPLEDEENIVRRMERAADCVASEIIDEVDAPSGGCDAAAEILAAVEFYELGQLHGLHPSIVYPAEHPKTGLSGDLMASMLTLSHFIKRAERAYEDDARVGERVRQLAATLVGRTAAKQGSWRAMYLDGFTGDALTAAAAMADTVLEDTDAIRVFLNGAVEEQRRRLAGEESAYEEEWPDADEIRKKRLKEMRENQPITERLFAMRNAALQMAQSGSKDQARLMLEEAFELRKKDVAKNNKDPENTAETLPELIALVHLLESRPDWSDDLVTVRRDVLRCVRVAVDEIAAQGDEIASVALLESALDEYEPLIGSSDDLIVEYRARVEELWDTAAVDAEERRTAVENIAGGAGAIAMMTVKYTKELESRRRPGR